GWLAEHEAELIAVRRALHQRPELGRLEHETTALIAQRLSAAGLSPKVLASGTGLVCDVGSEGPVVVLRADIDALPMQDEKDVPYRSQVPGVCHACGHDVHTAVLLGAGLALAARGLSGRVRLVFQPAEEQMPGGALDVLAEGYLDGVAAIFGLHCDPSLEVGRVGLKTGPITAAADAVEVRLTGPGGHTSRPHNTVDLVHALATVATGLPDALSRLVDPRAGLCLVWGHVSAGVARNAIPREGVLSGTLRVLDKTAWQEAPDLVERLVQGLVAPYGARATVTYERGVPPVVNDPAATALLTAAVRTALGPGAAVPTLQSLGGEDFAWYLDHAPGAMARLGVRPPGTERPVDLHQPAFDVDEAAIAVGVRVLVAAATAALETA
ncbi:MAG: N-acyl-L-amino acid amidohydrolase, partial [Frankiales bacterium]|nr:N-acyl-L-amino acid amidohydrolase [Frankiales bacterium]